MKEVQSVDQKFIQGILDSINKIQCMFNSKEGDNRDELNCLLSHATKLKAKVMVKEDAIETSFPLKIYIIESSADSGLINDGIGIPIRIVSIDINA
jgi:hypothetical protein